MNLETYCRKILNYAYVIQKHLYFIKRSGVKDCIAQGPVIGSSRSIVTFDSNFTKITTPFGALQLCTSSMVSYKQFGSFEEARSKISQELGLVKKHKKIISKSGMYVHYETYYELPTLQLEGTHTYQEVKKIWKKIQ